MPNEYIEAAKKYYSESNGDVTLKRRLTILVNNGFDVSCSFE